MSEYLIKSIALWGVSKGLRLPQAPLDRMNELFFLRELLTQLEIDCILDVGANRGQFARELRGIGYRGLILSFEPLDSEFLAMKEHFENDSQWHGYQVALGRRQEAMSITIPKLTTMSSLLPFTVAQKDTSEKLVEVRRLDSMLPSLLQRFQCSRLFLKMDTQGYDLEVFKGAAGCMDKIRGIQSELSVQPLYKNMPHYLEALDAYEAAGFDLYNLSVVNRVSDGGLLELNCFMRRAR